MGGAAAPAEAGWSQQQSWGGSDLQAQIEAACSTRAHSQHLKSCRRCRAPDQSCNPAATCKLRKTRLMLGLHSVTRLVPAGTKK